MIILLMMPDYKVCFQHEIELHEDSFPFPGFQPVSCKFGSSEDEYVDSDDLATNSRPRMRPSAIQNHPHMESNIVPVPSAGIKQEFRRRHVPHGWLHKLVHLVGVTMHSTFLSLCTLICKQH